MMAQAIPTQAIPTRLTMRKSRYVVDTNNEGGRGSGMVKMFDGCPEIRELLCGQGTTKNQCDQSGDVVFAIFLEPSPTRVDAGMFERCLNYLVKSCQPSPVMVHVELVVPRNDTSLPLHFATYLGDRSDWQCEANKNKKYYLAETANKWRAVPVFGSHAARLARDACNENVDASYSLLRYVSSAWGFRKFAHFLSDRPQSPAQCATLVARVLKASVPGALVHSSAWYAPSTLYAELVGGLKELRMEPNTTNLGNDASDNVESLLRYSDDELKKLTEESKLAAIRALTLKASAAVSVGDSAMVMLSQKQLANALFRWSCS